MTTALSFPADVSLATRVLKQSVIALNRTVTITDRILGIVGLLIFLPIYGPLTLFLWGALKLLNSRITVSTNNLFTDVQKADERSLMQIQSVIKKGRFELDYSLQRLDPGPDDFFIKPLIGEIRHSRDILKNAEDRLHRIVYPSQYAALTDSQKDQLRELSKNFAGVWGDEEYSPRA